MRYYFEMMNRADTPRRARDEAPVYDGLPRPSVQFKMRAWREFQRALDPLAPPKPLPRGPH